MGNASALAPANCPCSCTRHSSPSPPDMILAFIAAFAVMALRLGLYLAGYPADGLRFMAVHLMAIATIVFFTGHRALARDASTSFPDLLRTGMRDAALYSFLISAFIWLYYGTVETEHFPRRIDDMVDRAVAGGLSEAEFRVRATRFF